MNNDQDVILREKIEKREKFDTILAYVLLVILLGCIVLVLVLKFTRKEDNEINTNPEEYVPNYISLTDITNSLNSSLLVREYIEDGASFNSSVSGNSIVVSYVKDDVNINLNIPKVGNELMFTIEEDNSDIVNDIYKEVASIICVYYGNEDRYCRNTLDNMDEEGNDSIRIGNNVIYIDTTRSFNVNNEIVYNDVTKVSINENDYVLNMLDISISDINIVTSDNNIVFSGNINRGESDTSTFSVNVKLYDSEDNLIKENTSENVFDVEFVFDEIFKLDSISTYSIEIIK